MTAAPTPPARHLVIECLRERLGIEDIAVACGCLPAQVRAITLELRRDGIIQNIRFERPRCAA